MTRKRESPTLTEVFNSCLELPRERRRAFLKRVCFGDPDLQREVESLLETHRRIGDFLRAPSPVDAGHSEEDTKSDIVSSVPVSLGRYRLVEPIAEGGMGRVYRGVGPGGQTVAVKLIRGKVPSMATRVRFDRERRVLARLDHPGIVRLLDFGNVAGRTPYLVVEYVPGLAIDRYCRAHDLDSHERVRLLRLVCDAVVHAHERGVVHRDLKPQNILVTPSGVPKLLDFGISKLLDPRWDDPKSTTGPGASAMTLRYASPEQVRCRKLTAATDLYSLGVILYELLTGRIPYESDGSGFDLAQQICSRTPSPPSSWMSRPSRELDRVLLNALRKEVPSRYSSVRAFSRDLGRWLERRPVKAGPGFRWGRAVASVSRSPRLMTGIVGVLCTACLVGLWFSSMSDCVERARLGRDSATHYIRSLLNASNPYEKRALLDEVDWLREAGRRIGPALDGEPLVEAEVRMAIAEGFVQLWLWEEAVPHLRRALSLFRGAEDRERERLADCLALLGRCLSFLHDPESLVLHREALSIRQNAFGNEHPEVAESLASIGFSIWRTVAHERVAECSLLYRRALAMYRRVGVPDHPDVGRFSFGLAMMCQQLRRERDAEAAFRRALEIYFQQPPSRERIECLSAYALFLCRMGRLDEAERVAVEALHSAPRRGHWSSACQPLRALARVRQFRGDLSGARAIHEEALRHALTGSTPCVESLLSSGPPTEEPGWNGGWFVDALPRLFSRHSMVSARWESWVIEMAEVLRASGDEGASTAMLNRCLDELKKEFPGGHARVVRTERALTASLEAKG